jgi:hypothetical protein
VTIQTTPQISPIKQIESMYARLEKARSIYAAGKVHPIVGMEGHYAVECSHIDDGVYLVNGTCTCIDAQQRTDVHHGWCKHKLAVELFKEQSLHDEADDPKVAQANKANKATFVQLEPERSLEDQLEDLYPKAKPISLSR